MKQMTNEHVIAAIAPLRATVKDSRVRLRYISVDHGYAYASDGCVWAKFRLPEIVADGLYTEDAGGNYAPSSDMSGLKSYNMESVLPDKPGVASAPSAKLIEAAGCITAMPKAQRQEVTVLRIGDVQSSFDTANLLRTVKAFSEVCGDSFIVELYPMGNAYLVMFRCGDNIAMVAGLRTLPDNPYTIELE